LGWVAKEYTKGKILSIERSRDRVLFYEVNTPITTQERYLSAIVALDGVTYEGEFKSWHSASPAIIRQTGEAV
jgi:hypothetical protein